VGWDQPLPPRPVKEKCLSQPLDKFQNTPLDGGYSGMACLPPSHTVLSVLKIINKKIDYLLSLFFSSFNRGL